MLVHHSRNTGRFNFLNPAGTEIRICIGCFPNDAPAPWLEERWPEDEPPAYRADMLLSGVVELIAKRLESYWINTERDAKRIMIDWCRQHAQQLDEAWLVNRVDCARVKLADAEQRLEDFRGSQGSPPTQIPMNWIKTAEQPPTAEDGFGPRSVVVAYDAQYNNPTILEASVVALFPRIYTHWMPLPPLPQETK